jgi:hypothetical protein
MDINDAWLNNPYLISKPTWELPVPPDNDNDYEHHVLNPMKEFEWNPIKTCKCEDCDYDVQKDMDKIKKEIEGINNNIIGLCDILKQIKLDIQNKRSTDDIVDHNRLYKRGPYKKRFVYDKNGNMVDIG